MIDDATKRPAEEIVIAALAFAFGVFLLVLGIRGGTARATEGGLGMLALTFALWSFFHDVRAPRLPDR